jgi:hypothetical protein
MGTPALLWYPQLSPQQSLLAQNVCQHLQLLLLPQRMPPVWEGVLLPLLLRYPTTAKLLPILAILASGMAASASSRHSRLHELAAVDVIYTTAAGLCGVDASSECTGVLDNARWFKYRRRKFRRLADLVGSSFHFLHTGGS